MSVMSALFSSNIMLWMQNYEAGWGKTPCLWKGSTEFTSVFRKSVWSINAWEMELVTQWESQPILHRVIFWITMKEMWTKASLAKAKLEVAHVQRKKWFVSLRAVLPGKCMFSLPSASLWGGEFGAGCRFLYLIWLFWDSGRRKHSKSSAHQAQLNYFT